MGRILDLLIGWFFRLFNWGFEATNRGYLWALRRVVRYTGLVLLVYVGLGYLTYHLFKIVPTGYIPTQDQGNLVVNVQMPDASSISRTSAVVSQMAQAALQTKGVDGTFAVAGFSVLSRSNSSAAGFLFLRLLPFSERAGKPGMDAAALVAQINRKYASIQGGSGLVLMPPPVRGLGNAGGFTMEVEDRSGDVAPQQCWRPGPTPDPPARNATRGLIGRSPPSAPMCRNINVERVMAKDENVQVTDTLRRYRSIWAALHQRLQLSRPHLAGGAQADAPVPRDRGPDWPLGSRSSQGRHDSDSSAVAEHQADERAALDRIQRYDMYHSGSRSTAPPMPG